MGSGPSLEATHATHFQNPNDRPSDPAPDEEDEEHPQINISTKIVERLVEDARLASGAAAAAGDPATAPRSDFKDQIFMEKLKCIDEKHSQRCGLTVEDMNAMATRIDMRTANMVNMEPVCAVHHQRVIDCYAENEGSEDVVKCWDTVGAFSKCVQETAVARLRWRTQKEARERARRCRHVAHAREHALRDLGHAPPGEEPSE